MDKLKGFIMGALALVTPGNVATVKAIISGLVALGSLRKDSGDDITAAELDALWNEAAANFKTLGDEARASNAAISK